MDPDDTSCGESSEPDLVQNFILKMRMFRNICDKNAVNWVYWGKKAVFSIPATKRQCLQILCVSHLHNLTEDRGLRTEVTFETIITFTIWCLKNLKNWKTRGF